LARAGRYFTSDDLRKVGFIAAEMWFCLPMDDLVQGGWSLGGDAGVKRKDAVK